MENNNDHNIEKGHFDAFVHAVGSEIEQAQVRLITSANAQMLFHYWKMGNYILYQQSLYGWGGKIINKLAQAIRFNYPEKKGYSVRNLSSVCKSLSFKCIEETYRNGYKVHCHKHTEYYRFNSGVKQFGIYARASCENTTGRQ